MALAKVRLCLAAVEDILGTPAMRVMTQLVMAGVPVEGQLLPKFVELLLQGPRTVAASDADGSAVAFAGAQQKQGLSEWRMHRQARLLFIHEQLSELPHALETLRYVWLCFDSLCLQHRTLVRDVLCMHQCVLPVNIITS